MAAPRGAGQLSPTCPALQNIGEARVIQSLPIRLCFQQLCASILSVPSKIGILTSHTMTATLVRSFNAV
jgi:hypothetical protein